MGTFFRVASAASLCLVVGLGFSQGLNTTGSSSSGNGQRQPPPASGTWARTTHTTSNGAGTSLLLTDGTVICQVPNGTTFWKLTPDINGSYANGTWSSIHALPSGYSPLYFSSAVLADGRVYVVGGEYNGSGSGVWTNLGAVYNPVTDSWVSLNAPWATGGCGDMQNCVMPNGNFYMAHILDAQMASMNPANLTWTQLNPTGKDTANGERFDEEGWTLLPDGTIFTCEAIAAPKAQRYIPSSNSWISAGSSPNSMEDPSSQEVGPQVLRYDGTVYCLSANTGGYSAIYTPPVTLTGTGTWAAGPSFSGLDIADGPAVLLPDNNVLCFASPGVFNTPGHMYEFNGSTLTAVNNPAHASSDSSFQGQFLMLPTGQVLFTDQSSDVEIYTPAGTYQAAWQPTISSVSSVLQQSSANNGLSGTQLNGLSQCNAYGDDNTNATNYPIVRIQNGATGHVFYCRTHNHSTMAVATGAATVSTQFDVPAATEIGPSTIYAVANGIPSAGVSVNVVAPHVVLPNTFTMFRGIATGGSTSSLFYNDSSYLTTQPGPTLNAGEQPDQVQVSGTSPTASPSSLTFTYTGHANTGGLTQGLELYNFSTGVYDVYSTTAASNGSDSTVTITATGTLSNYVGPNNEVRARVTVLATGPTLQFPWIVSLGLTNWTIQ